MRRLKWAICGATLLTQRMNLLNDNIFNVIEYLVILTRGQLRNLGLYNSRPVFQQITYAFQAKGMQGESGVHRSARWKQTAAGNK